MAVSELKGVDPPIAPFIATVDPLPPVNVRDLEPLPLMVPEKVMLAPAGAALLLVGSKRRLVFNITGPLMLIAPPLVVTLPAKAIDVPV